MIQYIIVKFYDIPLRTIQLKPVFWGKGNDLTRFLTTILSPHGTSTTLVAPDGEEGDRARTLGQGEVVEKASSGLFTSLMKKWLPKMYLETWA